jgi:hypothetical protein
LDVTGWLLDGDPAIRWQVLRDLCGRPWECERARVPEAGWGARLLALRAPDGHWGGGPYTPKWISTTYTLLELRALGPPPGHPALLASCGLLLDLGLSQDGGINLWRSIRQSETCVTGMLLSISAALGLEDERLGTLTAFLLKEQMADGGWNCQRAMGATHGSFHTTISVLEALADAGVGAEAQGRGREFLLRHRLFRSHRTGQVVDAKMTRFAFPPRWRYDILRALDYFRAAGAEPDPRLKDAITIVRKRQDQDGRWTLPAAIPGRVHFRMEEAGRPSRWNTLRCLRVLQWWGHH